MHTIIVAGLGRCGSSMLMQMLHSGGVPCLGPWPSFEDSRTRDKVTPEFIASCAGQAVKVLDPQRVGLPGDVRVIWLDRDHRQQAKSHAKFCAAMMGLHYDREARRKLAASLVRDTHTAMALIGSRPLIRLRFEDVLHTPTGTAALLGRFIGVPFDFEKAGRAVRKRSPLCAPGLDMELGLMEGVGS
jgi:hypothetical protein